MPRRKRLRGKQPPPPEKRVRSKQPPALQPPALQQPPAARPQPAQTPLEEAPQLDNEDRDVRRMVYLMTVSHPQAHRSSCGVVLRAPDTFSREWLRDAVIDAFAHPVFEDLGNRAQSTTNLASLVKMRIFKEFHKVDANGVVHVHYHVVIKAQAKFRFMPIKRALLQRHGIATHWSTSHSEFWSAVRYCCVPSPKKAESSLDKQSLPWSASGVHADLFEEAQEPATAKALQKRRESKVLDAAASGSSEPRPSEIDVWPLIVMHNIRNTDDNREAHLQLVQKAKEVCTPAMQTFLFRIRRKLPTLIDDVWQWEEASDRVELSTKSRSSALSDAMATPCRCHGEWWPCIEGALKANGISASQLAHDFYLSFAFGRSETVPVIVLGGLHGGEGKSLLLSPIPAVLGEEYVLQGLASGAFPMMDLPSKKAVILNEWKFNNALISLGAQLLWFEGKAVPITKPQNDRETGSGHCLYRGSAPIFITSPLETLQPLIDQAEADRQNGRPSQLTMLMRRLHIYHFRMPCQPPRRQLDPCPSCFANFVMQGEEDWYRNHR